MKNKMKNIFLLIPIFSGCTFLTSCAGMPDIAKTADDILTDEVMCIRIDKQAMQKETDIHVNIDLLNKDLRQP